MDGTWLVGVLVVFGATPVAIASYVSARRSNAAEQLPRQSATAAQDDPTPKLVPLHDRIVIRPVAQQEVLVSGIVIPDMAKEKPQQGDVVAVGPGRLDDDGKRIPMDLKVGDRVLFAKYTGQEVKIDQEDLTCSPKRTCWRRSSSWRRGCCSLVTEDRGRTSYNGNMAVHGLWAAAFRTRPGLATRRRTRWRNNWYSMKRRGAR
jgi:chaperonin GroES